MSGTVPDERTFEIGLVMAGAISAGAYTAGVVDFLIEALENWEKGPEGGWENGVPPHRVRIKVVAGASAGGMISGILAATRGHRDDRLRQSWVDWIDMSDLLGSKDLAPGLVPSALDSTVIQSIADRAFELKPVEEYPPWVSEALHAILTVTNVRGVPFDIGFAGGSDLKHAMTLHADYFHFELARGATDTGERLAIQPFTPTDPHWDTLKHATIATGAFPIGLASQPLSKPTATYDARLWPVPEEVEGQHVLGNRPIPPDWPDNFPANLDFGAIDGGVLNNEPFGLAHAVLSADGANPRGAKDAKRAMIMVDPFPSTEPYPREANDTLSVAEAALGFYSSMRNQAMFKADQIYLALEPDTYSRYLIVPTRGRERFAIASGVLGGFGGFLSRAFREHDFQLGRRNCQKFLRHHLAIPAGAGNPVFGGWTAEMRNRWTFEDGGVYLPLVPLLGSSDAEVREPAWPHFDKDQMGILNDRIKARIRSVASASVGKKGKFARFKIWAVRRPLSRWLAKKIRKAIEGGLKEYGLMG